jgi:hypothetical protein
LLLISTPLAFGKSPDPRRRGHVAHFDFKRAEKRMREIERDYAKHYEKSASRYFGRRWARFAKTQRKKGAEQTVWQRYLQALGKRKKRPQRIDCTLYAEQAMKAGLSARDFRRMWRLHRKTWGPRGLAGWRVGYLLVRYFGWTAYAVIRPDARYYYGYLEGFRRGYYRVWRQPNSPIARYFIVGKHDRAIEALMRRTRFAWGFSDGGIHTWVISRGNIRENIWDAAPGKQFELPSGPLTPYPMYKSTALARYRDYGAHLLVVPPTRFSSVATPAGER